MAKTGKKAATQRHWFKLDNAAKIFPGQNTKTWSNIFRISTVLKYKIEPALLERALENVLPRFPCYDVRMRRGFFWYYLEKNEHKIPPVQPDIKNPCYRIHWRENRGFLFRVYYYENKISVDFFHALTDGAGATSFVSTLAAEYLRLAGHKITPGEKVLDLDVKADPGELEDSFARYGDSKGKPRHREGFVYHAKGTKMPSHTANITTGYVSSGAVLAKAREYGVTVTEFFAALMLDILYRKKKRESRKQKQVSVQIPVDLRRWFPSKTLRNFTMCYDVRIDPSLGDYTFEEILKQVSLYLRYINNPKELNAMMTSNLKLERNFLLRAMPLAIKRAGIWISFILTGERRTSFLLSNVGVVKLPADMREHVNHFIFMPGPGRINPARIGIGSFQDTMAITFANAFEESDLERELFTRLVRMGIHVKIESNRD